MAISDKVKRLAVELGDAARADNDRFLTVIVKDKGIKKMDFDDLDAQVEMDAGMLISVICTLITSITDHTNVPGKNIVKDIKRLLKEGGAF